MVALFSACFHIASEKAKIQARPGTGKATEKTVRKENGERGSVMSEQGIRWQQRFDNFKRAFLLLREAMESDRENMSQLEKEGIIQRFEYTFELAWNVLKDRMEYNGVSLDKISPKSVVRQAYASKYIADAEPWLKMIGDRNLMSHTYDFAKFEAVIERIDDLYLPILNELYMQLLSEINQ